MSGWELKITEMTGKVDTKGLPTELLMEQPDFVSRVVRVQIPDDCIGFHLVNGVYKQVIMEGEALYWEADSVLCLDRRFLPARAAVYLASFAAFAGVNFWIGQFGAVPVHRGRITVAEYCENFNRLQNYYGIKVPLNLPQG